MAILPERAQDRDSLIAGVLRGPEVHYRELASQQRGNTVFWRGASLPDAGGVGAEESREAKPEVRGHGTEDSKSQRSEVRGRRSDSSQLIADSKSKRREEQKIRRLEKQKMIGMECWSSGVME